MIVVLLVYLLLFFLFRLFLGLVRRDPALILFPSIRVLFRSFHFLLCLFHLPYLQVHPNRMCFLLFSFFSSPALSIVLIILLPHLKLFTSNSYYPYFLILFILSLSVYFSLLPPPVPPSPSLPYPFHTVPLFILLHLFLWLSSWPIDWKLCKIALLNNQPINNNLGVHIRHSLSLPTPSYEWRLGPPISSVA